MMTSGNQVAPLIKYWTAKPMEDLGLHKYLKSCCGKGPMIHLETFSDENGPHTQTVLKCSECGRTIRAPGRDIYWGAIGLWNKRLKGPYFTKGQVLRFTSEPDREAKTYIVWEVYDLRYTNYIYEICPMKKDGSPPKRKINPITLNEMELMRGVHMADTLDKYKEQEKENAL